jgi:hypothetical protein
MPESNDSFIEVEGTLYPRWDETVLSGTSDSEWPDGLCYTRAFGGIADSNHEWWHRELRMWRSYPPEDYANPVPGYVTPTTYTFRVSCACGCGEEILVEVPWRERSQQHPMRFMPGHRVRLYNRLRQGVLRDGPDAGRYIDQILERGWKPPKRGKKPQFGIEAEFIGFPTEERAADVLNRHGVPCIADGYHHETKPEWRVTSDSSVNENGSAIGLELVSPILQQDERCKEQVHKAFRALNTEGAIVDATCGIHIHHDARHLGAEEIAETVAHYAMFQPVINQLVHPYRVQNQNYYGQPMHGPREWWQRVRDAGPEIIRRSGYFERYNAVNLTSLRGHGTIEFRQHHGSLDASAVLDWADLMGLFLDIGTKRTWRDAFTDFTDPEQCSVRDMALYMGASDRLADDLQQTAQVLADRNHWGDDLFNLEGEIRHGNDDEPYCGSCGEYGHVEDDHDDPF